MFLKDRTTSPTRVGTKSAIAYLCLAGMLAPVVWWFGAAAALSSLASAGLLVFTVCHLSRRMTSLAVGKTPSPVFEMAFGAASRLLLVVIILAIGLGESWFGASSQQIQWFGGLAIPFYLLQLVIDVRIVALASRQSGDRGSYGSNRPLHYA